VNERLVSLASGAILAGLGATRRGVTGAVVAAVGGDLILRGALGYSPLYHALGWDTAWEQGTDEQWARNGIHITQSFSINRPREELYQYWRDFSHLPSIMTHLEAVHVQDDRRSHWVAKVHGIPQRLEWDAEMVNDEPNERIGWRSLENADVQNYGEVRFGPSLGEDRGTVVKVSMHYLPPAGQIGALVAKFYNKALAMQIREDLRNFKRQMEVGEILTISGQPRGTCMGQGTRES
jgi:uncharacterized membrane protein